MVVGENGVLNRAQDASKKTNEAKAEEARQMSIAEAAMNFENTEYEDKNGEKVTIPAGFAVSEVEGENIVDDGLVIIDSKGNEFVWIPCNETDYISAKDAVMKENWSHNQYYELNGGTDVKEWRDDYTEDDKIKLNATYTGENSLPTNSWESKQTEVAEKSIEKYDGFYIARYEAGLPNNNVLEDNDKDNGSVNKTKDIMDLKPISKKGCQAWNYITQPNAKMVSENMYKDSSSVASYLVDGSAWNYICLNIFKSKENTEITQDSSNWGNYKSEVAITTGSNNNFKKYNIYDMAGNMWEWTTEHHPHFTDNTMFAVARGRGL